MATSVKRVLFDVLKPREISIINLSRILGSAEGSEQVDAVVSEADAKTETVSVTISGVHVDTESAIKLMEESGVSIKGIDEISVEKNKD